MSGVLSDEAVAQEIAETDPAEYGGMTGLPLEALAAWLLISEANPGGAESGRKIFMELGLDYDEVKAMGEANGPDAATGFVTGYLAGVRAGTGEWPLITRGAGQDLEI